MRCTGAVQGVGFRPTVYRIATELGLGGHVINDPHGATAEVEGREEIARRFPDRLRTELPPLARIDAMVIEELPLRGEATFSVEASEQGVRRGALVPPDAALCVDCRREMEDPQNRRHHYPFTTCTNCGPRFSLVRRLPYDRSTTAMACFELCPDCRGEYADPTDRRFHAEPVCCSRCGPRLALLDGEGREIAARGEALAVARAALLEGKVLAVKGLGGFQIACRADSDEVVTTLRLRKRRPTKPFAVMVRDLEAARRLVRLAAEDEALLTSPRSPVVLAPRRDPIAVATAVAPHLEDLGVLLPTTPLHVELLRERGLPPLVMTSGNLSEEPICRGNREAVRHLSGIVDLFLLHDRDVVRRVDDSVVRAAPTGPIVVRRARGWVPEPLPLPVAAPEPILAVGGHLQVTAAVAVADQVFLSQHVGDLDSESARTFHREAIAGLEDFLQVTPRLVVSDLHPDYPSTWLAEELAQARSGRHLQVQHHHAHGAAVLGERARWPETGRQVLAVSLDGTGWGPDGTAWGGEWIAMAGDGAWRRLAHLEPLPLVGGERAVREPWRVATAGLVAAGADELLDQLPMAELVDPDRLREVARLAGSATWPRSTGAGRLFEACGAMLGLAVANGWEGEAAVLLESLAASSESPGAVWPEVGLQTTAALPLLPSSRLLAEAARRVVGGEPPARVAASFHATFSSLAIELCTLAIPAPTTVALGGGCLVNRLLIRDLVEGLTELGYDPLLGRNLPPGDGGLAYGQAVLGAVAAAGRGPTEGFGRGNDPGR